MTSSNDIGGGGGGGGGRASGRHHHHHRSSNNSNNNNNIVGRRISNVSVNNLNNINGYNLNNHNNNSPRTDKEKDWDFKVSCYLFVYLILKLTTVNLNSPHFIKKRLTVARNCLHSQQDVSSEE